jgi:hypothetical protein
MNQITFIRAGVLSCLFTLHGCAAIGTRDGDPPIEKQTVTGSNIPRAGEKTDVRTVDGEQAEQVRPIRQMPPKPKGAG